MSSPQTLLLLVYVIFESCINDAFWKKIECFSSVSFDKIAKNNRADSKNVRIQPFPDSVDNNYVCDCLLDDAIYTITRCTSLIRRLQKKDIFEEIHCSFDLSIYVCHRCSKKFLIKFWK